MKNKTVLIVKAYNSPYASDLELQEIKKINNHHLYNVESDYNHNGYYNETIRIKIYETRQKYHYEVIFIDEKLKKVTWSRNYSSTKRCNTSFVAREIIRVFDEIN